MFRLQPARSVFVCALNIVTQPVVGAARFVLVSVSAAQVIELLVDPRNRLLVSSQ